jgi:nucleotide-binding universal stress UspA family protein
MNWKPIVVGVDGSPESVRAAVAAAMIAKRAGTTCVPVCAVPDYEKLLLSYGMMSDVTEVARGAAESDRAAVVASLAGHVPDPMLKTLAIRAGRAEIVLGMEARRLGAELLVVGCKQHKGLDRLRGGTVMHLARTCDVPLLVINGDSPAIARVLVALDLSYASEPTFAVAQRWAELFGAQLRAMHVVEPMPMVPGTTAAFSEEYYRGDEQLRETGLWARISPPTEKVVRSGYAVGVIAREVAQWHADLVIVGSHGKGWVDRLLVGSTTEQLLHRPPTLTLAVPTGRPAIDRPLDVGALPWEERQEAAAAAARP